MGGTQDKRSQPGKGRQEQQRQEQQQGQQRQRSEQGPARPETGRQSRGKSPEEIRRRQQEDMLDEERDLRDPEL